MKFILILSVVFCTYSLQAQTRVDTLLKIIKNPDTSYVLVSGHRGGDWRNFPENSIPGLLSSIAMGMDIVEMDVRTTKDKQLVVIHDLTLDRTTTGKGLVADIMLDSLKRLYLKDGLGVATHERVPTLEEYLTIAKGRIIVYLDKSVDKVPEVLAMLKQTGTQKQGMFVLPYNYQEIKKLAGDELDDVLYVAVLDDATKNIQQYVNEYIAHLKPLIFQLRIAGSSSQVYPYLSALKKSKATTFIAATWYDHSMGHDDEASLLDPENGWGWLIKNNVRILETNRPAQLIEYLRAKKYHQ